jgi:hypothetical protein
MATVLAKFLRKRVMVIGDQIFGFNLLAATT